MGSQIPPGADLSKIASAAPPPGVVSQLDNPPTALTGTLIGISAFLIAWGVLFAAIRIWVNRRKLGVADGKLAGLKRTSATGLTKSSLRYDGSRTISRVLWYTSIV
jgi:hypothetical protein